MIAAAGSDDAATRSGVTLRPLTLYLPRPDSGMLAEGLFGSLLVMGTDPAIGVAVTAVGLN